MAAILGEQLTGAAQRIGWPRVFGTLLLIAAIFLRIWDPIPLELFRLKVFDFYQLVKPRVPDKRPVVIVDIDEASLESHGQWPWPRTLIAKLVNAITDQGAAAIAFDVVFAEPDRTSPHLIADALPELSEAARAEIRQARDHDEIFADTLLRSRVVLGQSAYNPKAGKLRKGDAPKASFATMGRDPKPYLLRFPKLLPNIPELEKAAKGRGMFTIKPDPDGVIRRVPLVLTAEGRLTPSLGADLLRVATDQKTYVIKTDEGGVRSVVISGVEIPTDANAHVWIYFSPHDKKRYVSAGDAIDGKLPFGALANKLVLIGTSASGLYDLKATPNEPVMPGVEVHAQLLENILSASYLKRPSYAIGAELALALINGLLMILLVPIHGALIVFLLGAGIAALLLGLSWYYFSQVGLLLDVAYPMLSSLVIFIALVFVNYFREEAQRQQIRSAFGQYLSPALVEQLAQDPNKLVLGGETREMTFLFSDVRGFTSISETYKENPQGLTSLMNQFLTPLSNSIMECRGTIDKYMGDAIMAFWNAPIDDPRHAVNACEAAIEMLDRLNALNVERERETKQKGGVYLPLDVGIGINTGECVVGNMGSDQRFDYSVLGDSVNLASRLEGQSKSYGLRIILGSRTAEIVSNQFATLQIDSIRVKGKQEPEDIYTLLGGAGAPGQNAYVEIREKFESMLSAYKAQEWQRAMDMLTDCRAAQNGLDLEALFALYASRIEAFKAAPPGPDWDGVFVAQTK